MQTTKPRLPVRLPVLQATALRSDGRRIKIHPAEVSGRFTRLQRWLYPALIAFYAALPWLKLHGEPLVFVDIEHRRFFFFGLTFNSTDFYLAFFVLSGVGFSLILLSALFGRVWCGYACPQTVFLEGVYRRIERLVEGRARERAAREQGPWTPERLARLAVKHALFLLVSLVVANLFLSYFSTVEQVLRMVRRPPTENWEAFLWVAAITGLMHFNFGWFREQLCVVICPYGRLQSVLADTDTLVVGYDPLRGEPRGKKGSTTGACVDCSRCVQVCPTGIDIRKGLQLECIGCARCVDACDEVMGKLDRPLGLIRYDSGNGLHHQPKRFWRPRVLGYGVALLAGVVALGAAILIHRPFEATLLRAQQAPYERTAQGEVVNRFLLHLASKSSAPLPVRVEVRAPAGAQVILPSAELELAPFESRQLPLVVEVPGPLPAGDRQVVVRATDLKNQRTLESSFGLLGL